MQVLNEKPLTMTESVLYLLSEEVEDMKGEIKAKGKCPTCQGKFTEIKKLGYVCATHQTKPSRYYVDFYHKSRRFKLFSDRQGQVLDSYQRARNLLAHVNSEIKNHTFDPTHYLKHELEKFYVSNLLDRFLSYKLEGDRIAPSYIRHYRRYVGIAKEHFGIMDVRELKKLDIVDYQSYVSENYNFGKKTLKNCLDIFKTFLVYLKSDLEILNKVPHFPVIDIGTPETTWLTPEAQRAVFSHVPDRDKPIVGFLMLSGCRPGEARALKCKDVNLEQGTMTISATFSDCVYREQRKGKKSKKATVPIHPEVFDYINNRVKNNLPEAFVFINKIGRHYSESALQRMWSGVREKAGLDKSFRLYDAARHSFASQLINSGVSIFNVSKLLGHSNTKITERYLHSDTSKLKVDVSRLSLQEKVVKLPKQANVDNS